MTHALITLYAALAISVGAESGAARGAPRQIVLTLWGGCAPDGAPRQACPEDGARLQVAFQRVTAAGEGGGDWTARFLERQGLEEAEARAMRDALAIQLTGQAGSLRPAHDRARFEGAASASTQRPQLWMTGIARGQLEERLSRLRVGEALGGGWRLARVERVEGVSATPWRATDQARGAGALLRPTLVTFAAWLLCLLLTVSLLLRRGLPLKRSARWALLLILAGAIVLRVGVAAPGMMRSNHNGYAQLVSDLQVLRAEGRWAPMVPPGKGAFVAAATWSPLISAERWFAVNQALGVLSVLLAALALRVWLRSDVAALAGAALLAFDPVHARLSASEVAMIPVGLLAWTGLAGLALFLRAGRRSGLWLWALSATLAVYVKLDAVLSVAGLGVLLVLARRGQEDDLSARPSPAPWRRLAQLLAPLAVAVALAAPLLWATLGDVEIADRRRYLGLPVGQLLLGLLRAPWDALTHNPLTALPYAPLAVSALVVAGLWLAWRARDREVIAWLIVLAVLFARVFGAAPLPFDEGWAKGDVRWNLHASVPWLALAALGARGVWEGLKRPWARALVLALAALSWLPAVPYLRARWSDQREADLVLRVARTRTAPALIVSASPKIGAPQLSSAARRRVPALDRPLSLLELGPWRGVPSVAASPMVGPMAAALDGEVLYYQGLACYFDAPDGQALHPACQRARDTLELEPWAVERLPYEPYSAYRVRVEEVELGFYRVVGPRVASQ
jgi:hypothetical protein